MNFQILTLFPERYHNYLETGLPSRALKKGLFSVHTAQLRDYADPRRNGRLDDTPYGGGPGMILEIGPIAAAMEALPEKYPVVFFTPRGRRLKQKHVRDFSRMPGLTLLAGFYEGVDERVAENLVDYQVSLGDFVLGSGDLPALCFMEAVTRLLPDYMGSAASLEIESNEEGLLEYPQYTRPAEYRGWKVPDVLLSGNHGAIAAWRRERSLEITRARQEEEKDNDGNG